MSATPPPPNVQYPSVSQPYASPPQPAPNVQYVMQPRKRSFLGGLVLFLVLAVVLAFIGFIVVGIHSAMTGGVAMEHGFSQKTLSSGSDGRIVAVYTLSGVIDQGAAQQFEAFVRDVQDNGKVKAVLLRVDSPGGSVTASDQIWAQVKKLKEHDKKLVVSMGTLAASGGYYVSSGADCIFAEETTITGSIGVIMSWFVVEQGLTKLGIDPVVLKSTHAKEWKDELSLTTMPTEVHRKHLQSILDTMQARFEKVVTDGRGAKITPPKGGEADPAPFNGKIYLGPEAKKLGLVDEIGYMSDAIAKAKELAKLTNPHVVEYLPRRGLFEKMMGAEGKAGIHLDTKMLDDLQTPRMMMLWHP